MSDDVGVQKSKNKFDFSKLTIEELNLVRNGIRKEFLIDNIGDNDSLLMQLYMKMMLECVDDKLPGAEKVLFRELVKNDKEDEVVNYIEKFVSDEDLMKIGENINEKIDRALEKTIKST